MKKLVKYFIIIILIVTAVVITGGAIFINNIMKTTENVTFNKEKLVTASAQIFMYDNNENEFGLHSNVIKPVVKIDELPSYVPDSFVSIEDKRFYEHHGLDYKRIAKAVYNNFKSGSLNEGASTISQQLIKNTHLTNEKTFKRKLNEMLLTKKLEKEFSKKDILETYLNVIYFGESSYGIEQAANTYFNKSAKDLTLAESATLAGIIKSPARFSPIYNLENSLSRRNLVLKQMLKNNKITPTQYELATLEDINLSLAERSYKENDLYAKAVLAEAAQILNLSEKDTAVRGLKIYTYLNADKQSQLENILNTDSFYHVNSYGNVADSLGIIINNQNYGVEAYAGKSQYNLVNFKRQPGSIIKPILVYAPAMEKGIISPATQILDEKIDYNGYSPNNVGGTFYGYVSVKDSISKSLNIPAIKVLDYVGIEQGKSFAKKAGLTFHEKDNGFAIALGGFTEGNNLKEITNSFLPFANQGEFKTCSFIKKIEDITGKTLYEDSKLTQKIMGEDTAYVMTQTLIDGVKNGTSKKLHTLNYEVAGKTGTVAVPNTNNNTDAYSVAYTTQHTMGIWLGNYSNEMEKQLESSNNGGTYATGIIKEMFTKMYAENKPQNFTKPDNVVELEIDVKTLLNEHIVKLADENCPERYRQKELFLARYAPKEYSFIYNNLSVENFDATLSNNICTISFEAKDYLDYEIVRSANNKDTIIATFENKEGMQTFTDTNLRPGTKYSYYVKVYNNFSNIYNESDKIIILTNKAEEKFNDIIGKLEQKPKQENVSWYFY